jgi:F-type H+-transporting ATPase subunit epsilon
MGILPNHAPVLSTLNIGVITVRQGTKQEFFTVTGGVVEVQPEIVTVLADASEDISEIDIARAEAAKQRAEELLEQGLSDDIDEMLAIEAALRRSNLRLDAIRKYRRGERIRPASDQE